MSDPTKETYFQQQRQLLINDVAAVSHLPLLHHPTTPLFPA